METKKYKFSFLTLFLNTHQIQKRGLKYYYLKRNIFDSYEMKYSIPEREKIELYTFVGRKNKDFEKRLEKVDWVETIYNIKVQKTKDGLFKVSFKVRLTPREAYIIGNFLKKKRYFEKVSYKIVEGQHGC